MRKAALKNRTRRKNSLSSSDHYTNPSPSIGSFYGPANGQRSELPSSAGSRRRPSDAETALTAKNYRLAKELSDLRLRHRDETKAVTRLTMENMNLAARVREAMNHVAMLKREVTIYHQKNAQLMIHLKERTVSSSTSTHTTRALNTEREIFSKQKTPRYNTGIPKDQHIVPCDQKGGHVGPASFFDVPENDTSSIFVSTESEVSRMENTSSDGTGNLFPHQPFESPPSKEAFKNAVAEDNTQVRRQDQLHVDAAFEASFETAFPESFSTPKEEPPSGKGAFDVGAFSDPFFVEDRVSQQKVYSCDMTQSYTSTQQTSSLQMTHQTKLTPIKQRDKNFTDTSMRDFENVAVTPDGSSDSKENFFHTPPFGPDFTKNAAVQNASRSPAAPAKKMGTETARARYVAATADPKKTRKSKDSDLGNSENEPESYQSPSLQSPTLVLKRLHERRAMDKFVKAEKPLAFARTGSTETVGERTDDTSAKVPHDDFFEDLSPSEVSRKNRISLSSIGEDEAKEENGVEMEVGGSSSGAGVSQPVRKSTSESSSNMRGLESKSIKLQMVSQTGPQQVVSLGRNGNGSSERISPKSSQQLTPEKMEEEMSRLDEIATSSPRSESALSVPPLTTLHTRRGSDGEIRRLDVLAGAISTESLIVPDAPEAPSTFPKRRSVRQPVSYAEPSLNSKLRRGDVFFPKSNESSAEPLVQVRTDRLDTGLHRQNSAVARRTTKFEYTESLQESIAAQSQVMVNGNSRSYLQ